MGSIKGFRVELALIDDLRKKIDDTFKISNQIQIDVLEAQNFKKKSLDGFKSFDSAVNSAKNDYINTKKMADNLGVEIPEKVILLYNEMLKALQEDKNLISKI
jgi:hypothetical protein